LTVIDDFKTHATGSDIVLTVENGDFIQGSPLTNYIEKSARDQLSLYEKVAQTVGYDARLLGNHEFNYGRAYLEDALAGTPNLLNANILDKTTGQPFIGEPYRIFEKQGVKIGLIGLTTAYIPHWEHPDHITGLIFADPVETAMHLINELRPQVDILAIAYHGGFAHDLTTGQPIEDLTGENQGYELLHLPGVDALITGHQHRTIAQVVNGVPTTQPGYRADNVGVITLDLDEKLQVTHSAAQLIGTGSFKEAPELQSLLTPVMSEVDTWLDAEIGMVGDNMQITKHFEARLHNHPFVELVNRVQMAATDTKIANTALFNDEVRGLPDQVTRRDVMTNYIYPNTLVVERLTGQDIKDALEVNATYFTVLESGELTVSVDFLEPKVQHYNYDIWSGIDYTFDFSQPVGSRVVSLKVQNAPMNMSDVFEVTMNNYRSTGAGNFPMFSLDKVVRENQTETADLIADYIADHPNIHIAQPTNLTTKGFVWTASKD
jgi:2',3'-cyclic-nucleotide 2'-phosphodiesterase/3'-nucleotidase